MVVQTGYLVPAGDEEAMSDRVKMLLEDEALRKSMSEAGREETERWSWEAATSVLRNVQYQKVGVVDGDGGVVDGCRSGSGGVVVGVVVVAAVAVNGKNLPGIQHVFRWLDVQSHPAETWPSTLSQRGVIVVA